MYVILRGAGLRGTDFCAVVVLVACIRVAV